MEHMGKVHFFDFEENKTDTKIISKEILSH